MFEGRIFYMSGIIKQKKLNITFHNPNSRKNTEKSILNIITEILSENIFQMQKKIHSYK